jgi:hypothetical protein
VIDPMSRPPTSALRHPGEVPTVLDIEASGFGARSYPIEVGFVLPDGGSWCSLIRPDADWHHWDDSAAAVHGLTRDLIERHGRNPHEVATALNEQLTGRVVYCDGWGHDYPWLAKLFAAARLQPRFRLEHLHRLLDDTDAPRFAQIKQTLATEQGRLRHRASTDARVLQNAWCQTMARPAPLAI